MRFHVNYHGVSVEYARDPMPDDRFKMMCKLAACGLYAGLTLGIAALCGIWGVVAVASATAIAAAFASL